MNGPRNSLGLWAAVAVGMLLLAAQGCTYVGNRLSDAKQMFDLGFTFTKTPQFGLYGNCPLVTPIGYSNIDGYYVGMGGGHMGVMRHRQKDSGVLLWGREENSWQKGEGDDTAKTEEKVRAGVVGLAQGAKEGERNYKPMCIHYLHLGWVGVTANFRYYEMWDFAAGLFGFDPGRDDRGRATTALAEGAPGGPAITRLEAPLSIAP